MSCCLTPKEFEILELLSMGITTNKEISRRLGIKKGTLKNHMSDIIRKLNAGNRTDLAVRFKLLNDKSNLLVL